MVWSFVYLALRRVPELMVLAGGRWTPGRWRSWSSVTSWPSCAASTHAPGSSPKTARGLRPSAAYCPGPMVDLHGRARDAAWMALPHGGPALDLSSAGTRPAISSPAGANPDRAAGQREPTLGRPAHPRGAAGPWLPGLRQLHRQGFCAPTASRGERPSRRWHPLIRPSRNCTGAGVVRAWSARPGCHWTTTGRIRRFLGQAVTDGLLL